MSHLLRVLYISKASPSLNDDDIRDILEVSRKNNNEQQITGVLCWGNTDFIQVLEGPEQALLKRYTRIMDDPRHSECTLLSIAPIEKRMFRDWSMGYAGRQNPETDSCRLLLAYRLTNDCRDQIVAIMQRFLKLVE